MKLKSVLLFAACCILSTQARAGVNILLTPGSSSSIDVETRLVGLGHTVTISQPSTWGTSFYYSPYDVVTFQFS